MKSLSKQQQQVWDVLSTPHNVDFKQFREEHDHIWLTKDRKIMYIEDMETSHIISCINMLERCGQMNTRAYDGLCNEINRRYGDDRWQYE